MIQPKTAKVVLFVMVLLLDGRGSWTLPDAVNLTIPNGAVGRAPA